LLIISVGKYQKHSWKEHPFHGKEVNPSKHYLKVKLKVIKVYTFIKLESSRYASLV